MRNLEYCSISSFVTKTSQTGILVLALMLSGFVAAYANESGGAATFKAKCAMCHGADGAGKTAIGAKFNISDLRSAEVQKKADNLLVETITKGKNKMPEFGSKLSADQINEVKDYIRDIAKKH